jgi:hypothetical protein
MIAKLENPNSRRNAPVLAFASEWKKVSPELHECSPPSLCQNLLLDIKDNLSYNEMHDLCHNEQ